MEVGPETRTIKKGHLPWSDFMVHNINQPLALKTHEHMNTLKEIESQWTYGPIHIV